MAMAVSPLGGVVDAALKGAFKALGVADKRIHRARRRVRMVQLRRDPVLSRELDEMASQPWPEGEPMTDEDFQRLFAGLDQAPE